MKKVWLSLVLVLLMAGQALAAGTCTASSAVQATVTVVTATCTADSSDGSYPSTSLGSYRGWIVLAETNPGTTGPTDNYDIVINNANGVDVMGGSLANRDTTNSERATPAINGWVDGALTLAVSNNSVNSATFVLKLLIYREP